MAQGWQKEIMAPANHGCWDTSCVPAGALHLKVLACSVRTANDLIEGIEGGRRLENCWKDSSGQGPQTSCQSDELLGMLCCSQRALLLGPTNQRNPKRRCFASSGPVFTQGGDDELGGGGQNLCMRPASGPGEMRCWLAWPSSSLSFSSPPA